LKYELIVSVWDDELFKGRIRVVSDDTIELIGELQEKLDNLEMAILEEQRRRFEIDDDIPF